MPLFSNYGDKKILQILSLFFFPKQISRNLNPRPLRDKNIHKEEALRKIGRTKKWRGGQGPQEDSNHISSPSYLGFQLQQSWILLALNSQCCMDQQLKVIVTLGILIYASKP